jgi:hypothetical protein
MIFIKILKILWLKLDIIIKNTEKEENLTSKNWKIWAFIANMIGCVLFISFTFLGMIFYAGGTYSNPSIEGYSFFMNFFSDIGRTISHSGDSNVISFTFFSLAFFLVGTMLIPMFLAFPYFFSKKTINWWISISGSCLGLFTAFCFIGITFAPSDIHSDAHSFFVYGGFISGFLVSLFYSLTIFRKNSYEKRYAFNFIFFTIILAFYLGLLFAGPSIETSIGLVIQVTGQKIVLYTFAVCLFIHGYGAYSQEKAKRNN